MTDRERTKRVMENIRKASEHCRKCKHERFVHLDGKKCSLQLLRKDWASCTCKEFVPPGNLDFVEYLAKKKGLI
jgi:hypothetical protein